MSFTMRWLVMVWVVFLFWFLFAQFRTEIYRQTRQQSKPVNAGINKKQPPMLGIVVPLLTEELARALKSLKRWPSRCSGNTFNSLDLILYFAEGLPNEPQRHFNIPCFRTTRVVSASIELQREETPVEVIRSVQFYQIFLNPYIRAKFARYDAIAILDWDIIVAHETSFDMLYLTTFTDSKPFWVKGSRLTGAHIDESATSTEHWHLGHLDGNGIYNNTDSEFIDYVNFTLHRWQLTRPYDAALWASLSDYRHSWPLLQRYSSNFIATSMVSTAHNVHGNGTFTTISNIAGPDTLFLLRRARGVENCLHIAEQRPHGCHGACGLKGRLVEGEIRSTVCDATCADDHSWTGLRFNGYGCGAGNHSKYGKLCRLCFLDQRVAVEADHALASMNTISPSTNTHVIMCETKLPPEDIHCTTKCRDHIATVCDRRCGNGHYGDWNCNWQDLGEKCRFCFRDIAAAREADKIAREAQGRVIMCETHEPPPKMRDADFSVDISTLTRNNTVQLASFRPSTFVATGLPVPLSDMNSTEKQFIGDTTHGNICAFIAGYFDVIQETRLAVNTILNFMPGVRVVIATNPVEYFAFYRAFAEQATTVSIVNDTRVAYASLAADVICGKKTRFIYYMKLGEVLSRSFTANDTHSPNGDLLVKHPEVSSEGRDNTRLPIDIAALLKQRIQSLPLTYESDTILPVEINSQLREVLWDEMKKSMPAETSRVCPQEDKFGTCLFHKLLDSMSRGDAEKLVPQLLTDLLFLRSPEGIQFIDPKKQSHHGISKELTTSGVPLSKPRFGCLIDLSFSYQGYDVAHQFAKNIDEFRGGEHCENGFIAVDRGTLKLKDEWEFPSNYPSSRMPSLRDFNISVMYRSFSGDKEFFSISLPTAIKYVPDALEIVVVVEEGDEDIFEQILASHREKAPFPLRLVTEPSLMDGHIQQKYSKMQADLYTKGDYVLHLDSDVLILRNITYEDIFHQGRPVLPFRRYREDLPGGLELSMCWKNGTSFAIGEDVVHEFSMFNTHVYPQQMYPMLRKFVEKRHGKSFREFMSTRVGKCSSPAGLAEWTSEERNSLLSDFNLMGAFLWYHMPDAVYWMAADPYDLRPDQWRVDLAKYHWVCQANGRSIPKDFAGKSQFINDFLRVTDIHQCSFVGKHWMDPSMKNPKTRTPVPWAECRCGLN